MFTEIADRIWVARLQPHDVTVTAVGGEAGVVVVDTHASPEDGRRVAEAVRALGAGDVVAVVNTHAHHDHVLGNAAVRAAWPGLVVHAHEGAAEQLPTEVAEHAPDLDPSAQAALAPDYTFSSATTLDLGDRFVELVHPGRGHTAGDLVARVPDADVVLAGDLVEESTQAGGPGFGPDCWPLAWPHTLDIVLGLLTATSTAVPGHGAPVGRDFVEEQRNAIGVVAQTVRDLAARGVPAAQALEATTWPYPAEHLEHAVARGYAHLARGEKRLPMV